MHFRTFLLMILMQSFMLIKDSLKTLVSKSIETKLFPFKDFFIFTNSAITQTAHQHCNWNPGFSALLIVLWSVQASSGSSVFTSQAIKQPRPLCIFLLWQEKRNFENWANEAGNRDIFGYFSILKVPLFIQKDLFPIVLQNRGCCFPDFTGKQQPFFNKVGDLGVATLLKRVTGVFLWNLRNCEEQFFVQISPGNCYYLLLSIHFVVINRYFNFWQIVDLKQRYTVARVVDQAVFDNIS